MKLYCKNCNTSLTISNLELTEQKELDFGDGRELLKQNKYILASEVDINFGQPIEYLINTKSISLINHKDFKKLQGCCGPGDLGVLNQICPNCKFEIGMLIADCWIPHFIGIDINKVSNKPMW